jgi:predicted transcriptional regulator
MPDVFDRNMKRMTDSIAKISRDVELAKSTADRALQKVGKG